MEDFFDYIYFVDFIHIAAFIGISIYFYIHKQKTDEKIKYLEKMLNYFQPWIKK